MVVAKRYIKERRTEWRLFIVYTQVTSRCSVQRDDLSSQARQRFEDIVVLH